MEDHQEPTNNGSFPTNPLTEQPVGGHLTPERLEAAREVARYFLNNYAHRPPPHQNTHTLLTPPYENINTPNIPPSWGDANARPLPYQNVNALITPPHEYTSTPNIPRPPNFITLPPRPHNMSESRYWPRLHLWCQQQPFNGRQAQQLRTLLLPRRFTSSSITNVLSPSSWSSVSVGRQRQVFDQQLREQIGRVEQHMATRELVITQVQQRERMRQNLRMEQERQLRMRQEQQLRMQQEQRLRMQQEQQLRMQQEQRFRIQQEQNTSSRQERIPPNQIEFVMRVEQFHQLGERISRVLQHRDRARELMRQAPFNPQQLQEFTMQVQQFEQLARRLQTLPPAYRMREQQLGQYPPLSQRQKNQFASIRIEQNMLLHRLGSDLLELEERTTQLAEQAPLTREQQMEFDECSERQWQLQMHVRHRMIQRNVMNVFQLMRQPSSSQEHQQNIRNLQALVNQLIQLANIDIFIEKEAILHPIQLQRRQ